MEAYLFLMSHRSNCAGLSSRLPEIRTPFSGHLVEELLNRRGDFLEALCLHDSQIRTGDVPEERRDLVLHDEVFDLRAANSRPAFDFTELEIENIWDLGAEVVDVRIPITIVSAGEENLGVVIQEDPAHVVNGTNQVHALIAQVSVEKLQESAHPLCSAWLDGKDGRQLRNLPLAGTDPASASDGDRFFSWSTGLHGADHVFQCSLRDL